MKRLMCILLSVLALQATAQTARQSLQGAAGEWFSRGLAYSEDGQTLAVAAPLHKVGTDNSMLLYIYRRSPDGSFPAAPDQILNTGLASGGRQLAFDQGRLYTAEQGASGRVGYIVVYDDAGSGQFVEVDRFTSHEAVPGDWFGVAFAVDNGTVIVGADRVYNPTGDRSGAAYIFERTETGYQQVGTFYGAAPGLFGAAVAILGSDALIGNPGDNVNAANNGAVHRLAKSGGVWSETGVYRATSTQAALSFGAGVALQPERVLVGVENANGGEGEVWAYDLAQPTSSAPVQTLSIDGSTDLGTILYAEGDLLQADTDRNVYGSLFHYSHGRYTHVFTHNPSNTYPTEGVFHLRWTGNELSAGAFRADRVDIYDIAELVSDTDGDGYSDYEDNCPSVANPGQENSDGGIYGDACDPNPDDDFWVNQNDNCPNDWNSDQTDLDNDGIGYACDDEVSEESILDGQLARAQPVLVALDQNGDETFDHTDIELISDLNSYRVLFGDGTSTAPRDELLYMTGNALVDAGVAGTNGDFAEAGRAILQWYLDILALSIGTNGGRYEVLSAPAALGQDILSNP